MTAAIQTAPPRGQSDRFWLFEQEVLQAWSEVRVAHGPRALIVARSRRDRLVQSARRRRVWNRVVAMLEEGLPRPNAAFGPDPIQQCSMFAVWPAGRREGGEKIPDARDPNLQEDCISS